MTTLHIDGSPTPRKMRDAPSPGFLVFNDGNENGSVRAKPPWRRRYVPQTSSRRAQQTLQGENTSAAGEVLPLTTSRLGNHLPAPAVSTQHTLFKVTPPVTHLSSPSHPPYATVK